MPKTRGRQTHRADCVSFLQVASMNWRHLTDNQSGWRPLPSGWSTANPFHYSWSYLVCRHNPLMTVTTY